MIFPEALEESHLMYLPFAENFSRKRHLAINELRKNSLKYVKLCASRYHFSAYSLGTQNTRKLLCYRLRIIGDNIAAVLGFFSCKIFFFTKQ
jgi:hypothetical protein